MASDTDRFLDPKVSTGRIHQEKDKPFVVLKISSQVYIYHLKAEIPDHMEQMKWDPGMKS